VEGETNVQNFQYYIMQLESELKSTAASQPSLQSFACIEKKVISAQSLHYHAVGYPIIESSVLTPLSTNFLNVSRGYTRDIDALQH
jgi:hypothetical protein